MQQPIVTKGMGKPAEVYGKQKTFVSLFSIFHYAKRTTVTKPGQ